MGGASWANTVMEQSGGGEHGTKHGGVMGCGLWAHGRVCGLGGPQGGRTRDLRAGVGKDGASQPPQRSRKENLAQILDLPGS